MYQVYLLSVVTLILASVSLAFDELDARIGVGSFFNATVFKSHSFQFGLGVVTMLVGFFQFLSVHPDDVIVIGNLIPAAAGMVIGGTLVLAYYRAKSTVESGFADRLEAIFLKNASNLGYLGLLIAVLHFFLHRVLLL